MVVVLQYFTTTEEERYDAYLSDANYDESLDNLWILVSPVTLFWTQILNAMVLWGIVTYVCIRTRQYAS